MGWDYKVFMARHRDFDNNVNINSSFFPLNFRSPLNQKVYNSFIVPAGKQRPYFHYSLQQSFNFWEVPINTQTNIVILITRNGMGEGDLALRHTLIDKYLQLLVASGLQPAIICFYAEGVKLVVKDSPVLETLRTLESRGVHLVVCATCLNYYGLSDQNEVGIVGGMGDILEAQWRAEKVITL